jgi:hypothetical protein
MDEKPKHRWFQFRFSLRTLFVLVTVVAIWFGWSLNWIRERRAFLRDGLGQAYLSYQDPPPAPSFLWVFGEEGAEIVCVNARNGSPENAFAKELFPEAIVLNGLFDLGRHMANQRKLAQ